MCKVLLFYVSLSKFCTRSLRAMNWLWITIKYRCNSIKAQTTTAVYMLGYASLSNMFQHISISCCFEICIRLGHPQVLILVFELSTWNIARFALPSYILSFRQFQSYFEKVAVEWYIGTFYWNKQLYQHAWLYKFLWFSFALFM